MQQLIKLMKENFIENINAGKILQNKNQHNVHFIIENACQLTSNYSPHVVQINFLGHDPNLLNTEYKRRHYIRSVKEIKAISKNADKV